MANRAYLYSANVPDCWDLPDDTPYYDSRWSIPICWWFLFSSTNLRLIEVSWGNDQWQEVRVVAERAPAIESFMRFRTTIDRIVEWRIKPELIDFFLAYLSKWDDEFLLMDPNEVLGGMSLTDAEHFARFREILDCLSVGPPDIAHFRAITEFYSPIDDSTELAEARIVGYTYGDHANELWKQIVEPD